MHYSKQRELIYKALEDNAIHPSAEYIYDVLKKAETRISLTTIYRNLNTMALQGRIKKIQGLEDKAHFDHNTHEHFHFICKKCGRVYDVPSEIAPDILMKAKYETGFQIDSYDVVFHGVCLECKIEGR